MKKAIITYLNGAICIAAIFAILVVATMSSYGDLSNGNALFVTSLLIIIAVYSAIMTDKYEQ